METIIKVRNYVLTDETINHDGHTLYRIKAIRSFNSIKVGQLGGYIESYDNLSENGWVGSEALVYDNAIVRGNARVYGSAEVCGNARVYGNAKVAGIAEICGHAEIFGHAEIYGYGVSVSDMATIDGSALIADAAKIYGHANVTDNAKVFGNAKVSGYGCIFNSAELHDDAKVKDAHVCGRARIYGDATIYAEGDYTYACICGEHLTYTKSNNSYNFRLFDGPKEKLLIFAEEKCNEKILKICKSFVNLVESL